MVQKQGLGAVLEGGCGSWNERALICFTSNSEVFYREAYDYLYAFQYLLKPVEEARIRELLARAEDFLGYMRERFVLGWR